MVGYKALNALTIFLQFGGMAVLMEGLAWPGHVPDVVYCAPAMANIGALGGRSHEGRDWAGEGHFNGAILNKPIYCPGQG
jgi:hypothetical protein